MSETSDSESSANPKPEVKDVNEFTEFFIQTIPCYIFVLSFILRYLAIKDMALAKRTAFSRF